MMKTVLDDLMQHLNELKSEEGIDEIDRCR